MISPENVSAAAEKRENENLRFRTFLKNRADPDELDRQFLTLHKELFAGYDCCRCGNCCRTYSTTLIEEEIVNISTYLGLTRQIFLEDHLIRGRDGLELPEGGHHDTDKLRQRKTRPSSLGHAPLEWTRLHRYNWPRPLSGNQHLCWR